MKKYLCLFMSVVLAVCQISVLSYAVFDETDHLSVRSFAKNLASLIELSDTLKNNTVYEASIDAVEGSEASSTNRIIVKSEQILNPLDSVGYINGYNDLHILQFDNAYSCEKALDYYSDLDYVEYAEIDVVVKTAELDEGIITESSTATVPGKSQADAFGYTAAKSACSTTRGVDVAVIDSGVQNDHPYLVGRVSPTGFNAVTEGGTCYDDRGHGTQVAGIIAANTKSNVTIYPYKVLNKFGEGSASQVALGIDEAIGDYVDIINLSLSTQGTSQTLYDAVLRANAAGIIVVAAAGNAGANMTNSHYSPGNFAEVISVVSCSNARKVSSFSNYGGNADVAAPGENVLSTTIDGKYKISSGTSMAAPFIVSAVCYLLSKTPGMTLEAVETSLKNQTKPCAGTASIGAVYPATSTVASQQTPEPIFALDGGKFIGSMNVEIYCSDENTDILYKTSAENIYTVYTGPFTISATTTVTAFATSSGKSNSKSVSATFTKITGDASDFTVDDNGNLIGYSGTAQTITIPSYVDGKKITNIAEAAFSGNTNIRTVLLQTSVTSVGDRAFKGCTSLTTFSGSNISTIGDEAFADCTALYSLSVNKLTYIGARAFENAIALKEFQGTSVVNIGDYAFYNSGISNFNSSALITAGDYAFGNCNGLVSVSFIYLNSAGRGCFSGCSNLASVTLNSLSSIPDECFKNCVSLNEIQFINAKSVGVSAFENCIITNVYLPAVTSISDRSFAESDVLKVTLDALYSSEGNPFFNCSNINSITLPNIKTVDLEMFKGAANLRIIELAAAESIVENNLSLGELTPELKTFIAPTLKAVPDNMFKNSVKLTKCELESATAIGKYAFSGSGLTAAKFPKVKTVDEYSFADSTSLQAIELHNLESFTLTSFLNCPNVAGIYWNNLKEFPQGFFVKDISVAVKYFKANSVIEIPDNLFSGCDVLQTISFSNVVKIGANAFYGCDSIEEMIFPKATDIAPDAFAGTYPVLIQLDSYTDYNEAIFGSDKSIVYHLSMPSVTDLNGQTFEEFVELEEIYLNSVLTVPDNCFKSLKNLLVANVSSAKTLGAQAFYDCTLLSEISIEAVESIGSQAFYNCKRITYIAADSLKSIDLGVFNNCSGLITLSVNGLTELPASGTFKTLKYLETFSAESIKSVPDNYFEGLTKLKTVNIDGATTIGISAFEGCTNLETVYIEAVTELKNRAFYGCAKVKSFTLDNLTTLGVDVFTGCAGIKSISVNSLDTFPDTVDFTTLTALSSFSADSVSIVPARAFEGNVTLADVSFKNATEICEYAFCDTNLIGCTDDAFMNVKIIGDYAFKNTRLASYNFTNTTHIGEGAFYGASITDVTASNISYLGEGAFENSDVKTANITGITEAPDRLFKGSVINSVSMPDVTEIGYEAFANTEIHYIEDSFSSELFMIKDKAFYNCTISAYDNEIDEGFYYNIFNYRKVSYIGNNAFNASTFRFPVNEEFPELTYIGKNALGNTFIDTIILPNIKHINDIPDNARIMIGSAVTQISGIGENVTIIAPKTSYALEYAQNNNIDYLEFKDSEEFIEHYEENTSTYYYPKYYYGALGFNLKYKWYAANSIDLSDSVFIGESNCYTSNEYGLYSQMNPFNSNSELSLGYTDYTYFYCIAESTENGNIINVTSPIYYNYMCAVKSIDDEMVKVNGNSTFIISQCLNSEETFKQLSFTEGMNVEITPTFIYGDTNICGTGTKFSVYKDNGEFVKSWILVIRGDVTGDGVIDVMDLSIISSAINKLYTFDRNTTLGMACNEAKYVTDDRKFDVYDYNLAREKALA